MTHTKGKWTVITNRREGFVDPKAKEIWYAICEQSDGVNIEETRANARLIAACPAMYEALKSVSEYLNEHTIVRAGHFGVELHTTLAEKISKAIAAAEGKTI